MGSLLNSVSVLLCASERTAEFIFSVAPILAPVFHAFLGHHSVSDFMDDFAAILDDLVSPLDEGENNIPPVLWEVATTMIQFMLKDETAFLYFQGLYFVPIKPAPPQSLFFFFSFFSFFFSFSLLLLSQRLSPFWSSMLIARPVSSKRMLKCVKCSLVSFKL